MTRQLKIPLLVLLTLGCSLAHAGETRAVDVGADASASARSIESIIEDYVHEGLRSNLTLANHSLEADKSLAALREARARYFPNVALNARYTAADGGRQVEVPVAQLLNPAYQTLNQLLVAQGSAPRFPPIADQSFPLLRAREQDTHIAIRQPLYAPGLASTVAAANAGAAAAAHARQAFARELRRDIVHAYLNTLKAQSGAAIVDSSVTLLQENLRVNESLRANGRLTQDAVLRAKAELLAAQQQQLEARNGITQSRGYFNFLLNRPLDSSIEVATVDAVVTPATRPAAGTLAEATSRALAARPELQRLESARQAADAQLRAARATRLPSLSLGVDAGTQGSDYGFGRNYNYVTGSLLLGWTLFDGGARSAAIARARLAARQSANLAEQNQAQVSLEVQQAHDGLRLASESLLTASARAEAAEAAFRIASRKRDEGVISQVEFLDARNALTGAQLNLNWTRFDVLQRQADFAFATAADPLNLPDESP